MNVSKDNPGILVMDNHESHVTLQTIDLARENGLIILSFPPHCSHRMQPLDVSVYGPFKPYYIVACTDWMLSHPGRSLTIYDIATLSGQAFYTAITPANAVAGFTKPGIYPINRAIFTDDLLLPSAPTDRDQVTAQDKREEDLIQENTSPVRNQPPAQPVNTRPTITADFQPLSPEDIRPYPKAAPRQENIRR